MRYFILFNYHFMSNTLFPFLLFISLVHFILGCDSKDNEKHSNTKDANEHFQNIKQSQTDSIENLKNSFTGISFIRKEYTKLEIIDSLKSRSVEYKDVEIIDNSFIDYDIQGNWLLNSFADCQNCDEGSALIIPRLQIGELELINVIVLFYFNEIAWIMIVEEQKGSQPKIYDLLDLYRLKYANGIVRNDYGVGRTSVEYSNNKDSVFASFLTKSPVNTEYSKGVKEIYSFNMSFPSLKKLKKCAKLFSKETLDSLEKSEIKKRNTLNQL